MNHPIRKFISSALTVSTTLAMTGLSLISPAYAAGQLKTVTMNLTDVRPGTTSNHTLGFSVFNSTTIKGIKIQYAIDASSTNTVPDGLNTWTSALLGATTKDSTSTGLTWNTDFNSTHGTIVLTNATGIASLTGFNSGTNALGSAITIELDSVTNNSVSGLTNPCDAITDSETCYVRVTTYSSDTALTSPNIIDAAVGSYTIVNPVTVTATVDPTLIFTVSAVTAGNIATNDANAPVGTTSPAGTGVDSTTTSLPFANLALNKPRLAQQGLSVKTNAYSGYDVDTYFIGSDGTTDLMKGTYSANNIDRFTGSGLNGTWASPKLWASPVGNTKNVNSAWLGTRTTNAGVSGFGSSNYFAPPCVGYSTTCKVMVNAGPDDGTALTYVSYKIEANAYQPADSYTGTMVYNVVPSY